MIRTTFMNKKKKSINLFQSYLSNYELTIYLLQKILLDKLK